MGRGGEGRGVEGGGEGRGGEGRGERDIKLQVKMNRVIRLLYSLERGERGGRYKNYFIPVSCDTSSVWLHLPVVGSHTWSPRGQGTRTSVPLAGVTGKCQSCRSE